jgi:hypothetical protein
VPLYANLSRVGCSELVLILFSKSKKGLWDIEVVVQVKQFCEEESLVGSHPRQDNVNPISTFVVPLVDN